jgi:hypothetical protein
MERLRIGSLAFVATVLLALSSLTSAAIIKVPADQPTIQAGINAASDYDTVLVAPGTYTGTGNRDISFLGKSVKLISEEGTEVTIIDCQSTSQEPHRGALFDDYETSQALMRGFTIKNASEAIRAYRSSPTIRNCVLGENTVVGLVCKTNCNSLVDSVTVSGCSSSGLWIQQSSPTFTSCEIASNYGGMYCLSSDSVTMIGCDFLNNSNVPYKGGAIYTEQRNRIYLTDCVFKGNTAGSATVIYVDYRSVPSHISMSGCRLEANEATGGSYSLFDIRNCTFRATDCVFQRNGLMEASAAFLMQLLDGSASLFRRCTFVDNYGILMYAASDSPVELDSCIITRNQSWEAVVYVHSGLTVTNCTFVRNYMRSSDWVPTTIMSGDEQTIMTNTIIAFTQNSFPLYADPAPTLNCCNFYGNTAGDWLYYSDQLGANGNVSIDPMFCNLEGGSYYLRVSSPCAPANNECVAQIGALGIGCCGDANGDGILGNGADMMYVLYYIFASGPTPDPVAEADTDCSGFVDIDDVVYIILNIFAGGPEPCAGCE